MGSQGIIFNNSIFEIERELYISESYSDDILNNSMHDVDIRVGIYSGSENTTIYGNIIDGFEVWVDVSNARYTNITNNLLQDGLDNEGWINAGIKSWIIFLVLGLIFILDLILSLWVLKDSKKRELINTRLWITVVALTGMIGFIGYLWKIRRPTKKEVSE